MCGENQKCYLTVTLLKKKMVETESMACYFENDNNNN